MDWREIYARRLCTPEQAAALIAPGDRIFAGGAGSFPAVLIDAVSDRAELRGIPVVTVVNGTESRALSDPVCFARTPYHSLFLGRADRKFQQRGGLHENSVQFHQTVRAAREVYRVNTLMLEVSEPDADGYLYYGPRGTAWSSLDTQVEKRIYQVNAFQQRTRGEHHRIHVSEVTALCRADHPLNTYHYKAPMHSMRALPRTSCRSSGTAIRCRSASAAFPTPSPTGCMDANGSGFTRRCSHRRSCA